MTTLADTLFATAPIGAPVVLPRAGTWLENEYVYDATARDIKRLAATGAVEIVGERLRRRGDDPIISHLSFKRLR